MDARLKKEIRSIPGSNPVGLLWILQASTATPQQRSRWDTISDVMGAKADSDAVAAVAKDLDRICFQNASCNFIT